MVANAEQIIPSGTFLMLASIIVLPITIMEFYFGPWLIKDSGLFHLDERDRSLSNVGDDLRYYKRSIAAIDIILILIELTISVGPIAPWLPIFVILIPLGPLLSIVLNFTIIFMIFKKKATVSMIEYLSTRYEVPDIHTSHDYIRSRVLALVERDLLMNPSSDHINKPEESTDVVVNNLEKTEPLETTSESITEDDS